MDPQPLRCIQTSATGSTGTLPSRAAPPQRSWGGGEVGGFADGGRAGEAALTPVDAGEAGPDAGHAADEPRAVYRRLPSLQGLSVDVGHTPGGGTAAGLPPGSGAAPDVTILARVTARGSAGAAGEGEAVLSRALLPALRSLAPSSSGPEQVRASDRHVKRSCSSHQLSTAAACVSSLPGR